METWHQKIFDFSWMAEGEPTVADWLNELGQRWLIREVIISPIVTKCPKTLVLVRATLLVPDLSQLTETVSHQLEAHLNYGG